MEDKWICKICGDSRDKNSYVTTVTTVTGQVLKADEDGRVIDVEPKFPIETEHLCYTCYEKKYKEPAEQLEAIKKLVEQDLPQIGMTIYFRRRFYQVTGYPAPEWFKDCMEA